MVGELANLICEAEKINIKNNEIEAAYAIRETELHLEMKEHWESGGDLPHYKNWECTL